MEEKLRRGDKSNTFPTSLKYATPHYNQWWGHVIYTSIIAHQLIILDIETYKRVYWYNPDNCPR